MSGSTRLGIPLAPAAAGWGTDYGDTDCTATLADGRTLTLTVSNPDGGGNLRYQVTAAHQ